MLFVTYWELNEDMSSEERNQAATKLTSSGLFPPAGVNIINWSGTVDNWGVLLLEADNAADVARAINMWRAAAPGFFEVTKTSPALPVSEMIGLAGEIMETLGGS